MAITAQMMTDEMVKVSESIIYLLATTPLPTKMLLHTKTKIIFVHKSRRIVQSYRLRKVQGWSFEFRNFDHFFPRLKLNSVCSFFCMSNVQLNSQLQSFTRVVSIMQIILLLFYYSQHKQQQTHQKCFTSLQCTIHLIAHHSHQSIDTFYNFECPQS